MNQYRMVRALGGLCLALCGTGAVAKPHAQSTDVPIVINVPQAPRQNAERADDPEADLELAIRTFSNILLHRNPAFRGAAGLHEDVLVTMLLRDGSVRRFEGENAKKFLVLMFDPDRVTFHFAAPAVAVEGRYGTATRRLSVQEKDSKAECLTLHAEAVKAADGWRFVSLTLAEGSIFEPCEIKAD